MGIFNGMKEQLEEKSKFYKGKGFKIGLAVIVLAFIFKGCGSKPNDTTSTNATNTNKQVEQKTEVKQENTYGLKSTDLAKIKEVKKDGDTLIVSTNNSTKGTEKGPAFVTFRMAVKDVIKQVESSNLDYKILQVKDYKGNENLFTATFSKDKINTIKDDVTFMGIMKYADKIDGYEEENNSK